MAWQLDSTGPIIVSKEDKMSSLKCRLTLAVFCGVVFLASNIWPVAVEAGSVLPQLAGFRVGIQAGHGQGDPGASSCDGTVHEADITAAVAGMVVDLLHAYGAQVDLFIGRDPGLSGYEADAFVALHADYCPDPANPSTPSGYKVARYGGAAGSGLNGSGDSSDQLVQALWDEYGRATGLPQDRSPGRFMPGMLHYYALGQIDASTPGAIIEMGWLSGDLAVLVDEQDRLATGIANSIVRFLAAGPPSQAAQSATVLLIDVSGSMGENWQGGVKIESAKAAAVDVINMIEQESQVGASDHQVAIATFTTDAYLDLALTTDYNVARQVVNGLMPLNQTNIGAGLQISNQALTSAPTGAQKIIILLSDGLTNEELSPQEILDGPVQEAATAGTCIYTVGFGDPGALDEELLQNIAAGAACGEYNYASAPDKLEWVYVSLRHQSLGQVLGEFHGQVAQGEQVDAGQVDVLAGQGELYASLYWPGSVLGLVMTDPQGQVVDENYPGAIISTYPRMVYAIVDDPLAGTWDIDVFGQDVPAGTTRFDAIVSSRVALVTPVPTAIPTVTPTVAVVQPSGSIGPALVFLVVVVGAVALLVLNATRGRMQTATAGVPGVARPRLIIRSGRFAGREFPLGAQGLTIGRGRGNDVQLEGNAVSRRHAVIQSARGQFFLQDQGSTHGTYLNGQRVEAAPLSEGDVIRIGDVELEFRVR